MKKINIISSVLFVCCLSLLGCQESALVDTSESTPTTPIDITSPTEPSDAVPIDPTAPAEPTDPTAPIEPKARKPNILLIISDDQGLDSSAQYSLTSNSPNTPVLNALASGGLVFDNAWATPACTTTRSSIITGKHGVKTSVLAIGDVLPESETVLHKYLSDNPKTSDYESALIGKWHLGGGNPSASEPNDRGIPYYAGILAGSLSDYSDWDVTEQGATTVTTQYSTSKLTDMAVSWVGQQDEKPWFLWLAYNAPHTPFHLPPQNLQTTSLSGDAANITANPRAYYLAAIEAMDTEIGRLLDSMPTAVRENTIVMFVGDNGSPSRVRDQSVYAGATKGSLREGGLSVPMIVSGKGVTRAGQREDALIGITDFFATVADLAGAEIEQINDSVSFKPLLTVANQSHRNQVFVEFNDGTNSGYAIKNTQYKYMKYADGSEFLYDLSTDSTESNNLIGSGANAAQVAAGLEALAEEIRGETGDISIPPGTTDITNAVLTQRTASCADYVKKYSSTVNDIGNGTTFNGAVEVTTSGTGSSAKCVITSNGIPNHDFNDAGVAFRSNVASQSYEYEIPLTPSFAPAITPLQVGKDRGVMLNGVKIELLAAACHGVDDERTGCGNGHEWRFDPLFAINGFRMDNHNAHTQPDGSYHYHGSPKALFSESAVESPLVGFASDGFPIFGTWFTDTNNVVREAVSSYRLKSGDRPSANGAPGGSYDGTFRDDYEYVNGLGDLDECNGMILDGVYGYYVTESFPYLMGCFKGTLDETFIN